MLSSYFKQLMSFSPLHFCVHNLCNQSELPICLALRWREENYNRSSRRKERIATAEQIYKIGSCNQTILLKCRFCQERDFSKFLYLLPLLLSRGCPGIIGITLLHKGSPNPTRRKELGKTFLFYLRERWEKMEGKDKGGRSLGNLLSNSVSKSKFQSGEKVLPNLMEMLGNQLGSSRNNLEKVNRGLGFGNCQ